jgi:Tfp pilus assembly protein PilN
MERAAANRQRALLNSEIGRFQTRLHEISKLLAHTDNPERMTETSSLSPMVVWIG